ncbi:hypothetical protein PRtIB026_A02940 [Pseudomonas sp. RtIB026]|nr:hypothetical protein PRtIB026_A02940 [Pseudomonas sp. RtIB026]
MVGWVGGIQSDKRKKSTTTTEIEWDPLNWISIMKDGTQIAASIFIDGKPYRLEPISANKHVLFHVDESKQPPDQDLTSPAELATARMWPKSQPSSTHSYIRLLFATTRQSRAAHPNSHLLLTEQLQNVNTIIKNSGVAITFELAGFLDSNYDESGKTKIGEILNDLTYRMEDVKQKRDELGADLVSMLVANSERGGAGKHGPSKQYGFSVISNLPSLAHEIGHNFGMYHNWEEGEPRDPPYVNGYRYTGSPRFRTQMSYDCSGGTCPRIPFYSNPNLTYSGIPIGTASHHNVARGLNERREIVENFYPDPKSFSIRAWVIGTNNNQCYIPLIRGNDDGTMLIIQSREECKDNKIVGKSVEIADWQGVGKLCFANLPKTLMICYSGRLNGERFKIDDLQTGAGKPDALTFTKRGVGEIHRISFD